MPPTITENRTPSSASFIPSLGSFIPSILPSSLWNSAKKWFFGPGTQDNPIDLTKPGNSPDDPIVLEDECTFVEDGPTPKPSQDFDVIIPVASVSALNSYPGPAYNIKYDTAKQLGLGSTDREILGNLFEILPANRSLYGEDVYILKQNIVRDNYKVRFSQGIKDYAKDQLDGFTITTPEGVVVLSVVV